MNRYVDKGPGDFDPPEDEDNGFDFWMDTMSRQDVRDLALVFIEENEDMIQWQDFLWDYYNKVVLPYLEDI